MTKHWNSEPGKRPGIDAARVKEALLDRAESLFREAWEEPEKASAREWRARDSSARWMDMQAQRGRWFDHKAGQGGDILDFFAVQFCGLDRAGQDFPRVLADAARWAGIDAAEPFDRAELEARQAARRREAEAAEAREAAQKAATVAELIRHAEPVKGSPAEAYLVGRGIEADSWPDALAYMPPVPRGAGVVHPDRAALVAWATDDAGKIMGGQRVLILADGSKAPEVPGKPSFGTIAGYPARFPERTENSPLCIAEGPETALAIWQATGFEVWAVFGAGQFQTAPLPTGRKVVFCPDRDAPDSSARRAFQKAIEAHAEGGVQVWIAEAPEDEGSKRDLADTLQRAGAAAVADAIAQAKRWTGHRGAAGRFTGAGAEPCEPLPPPEFLSLEDAEEQLAGTFEQFLEEAAAWDAESGEPAPVWSLKATPGAGKSVGLRRAFQGFDLARLGGGDAIFYSPTMALSDEAADDAKALGLGSGHVSRGRTALNPETGQTMCARPDEAEALGKMGVPVNPNLCKRDNGDGTMDLCPFYAVCAGLEPPEEGGPNPSYLRQWDSLPPEPVLRFEAHSYLDGGRGDGSGRAIGLRIVDEKAWEKALRHADVRADAWARADLPSLTRLPRHVAQAIEAKREAETADRVAVAQRVLAALQAGESPVLEDVTAEEFEQFAKDDADTLPTALSTPPSGSTEARAVELKAMAELEREGRKRAAVWRVLADAKRRGIAQPERLQWLPDYRGPKGDKEPRDVLRVHWLAELPTDKPMILLDADADPVLIDRLHPGARQVEIAVQPRAEVVQVADRTFSKAALIGPEKRGNREAWAEVIRAEVFLDNADPQGARGVLAGASKEVVRAMFEDAGWIDPKTPSAEADSIMRETSLHGARWLWFGPGSLGLNSFQDFGTAILIGREELPTDALEDMGRAVFGDSGEPLQLVQPDAEGRKLMPFELVPYQMADGSGWAAKVRVHPDRRIAAPQRQKREHGSRQLIERLRLVRAGDRPKRVILGSNVPLPDFPVSELVKFDDLRPSRLARAGMAADRRGGVLRLSAAGLAEDAPEVFRTVREAEAWLEREGREAIKYPRAGNDRYISGAGVLNGVRVQLRLIGQRGKATPALVFGSGDPRARAEAQLGELAAFEVIDAPPPVSSTQESPSDCLNAVKAPSHEREQPPPKRLVMLPPAEQIDSPLMAERIAARGKPGTGYERPRHKPLSHYAVIAGQSFLIWTRRAGREVQAMIEAQRRGLPYLNAGAEVFA
ncbi:hypothetical protein EOM89_01600 [Candidatus Falkowbacteria bacterium]|nr:hypothetical protein [Candidatus Falkowbacteria bacterium]